MSDLKDNPKAVLRFSECTLAKLDDTFGLKQIFESAMLDDWLNRTVEISDFERQSLQFYQYGLKRKIHDWNEQDLSLHFIGPMFSLVNFTSDKFNLFAERSLAGVVEGIELRGEPDEMIASGVREPKTPYFCFQEYKRLKNPEGDPAGQCLVAMLVAQTLNKTKQSIYGCYVMGREWYFMVLQGREYAISEPYTATREDIFDIFRILKALKQIIVELVND